MAFLGFHDKEMMSVQDIKVLLDCEKDNILTIYPSEIIDFLVKEAKQ